MWLLSVATATADINANANANANADADADAISDDWNDDADTMIVLEMATTTASMFGVASPNYVFQLFVNP